MNMMERVICHVATVSVVYPHKSPHSPQPYDMGKGGGGHGGLNILPHKSWHVWNFEARERVRRDEEAAACEERQAREQQHDGARRRRHETLLARATNATASAGRASREADSVGLLPLGDVSTVPDGEHARLFGDAEGAKPRREKGTPRQPPGGSEPADERFRLGYNAGGRAGDPVPWYARANSSLYDQTRDSNSSLPARVRRINAEEDALRRGDTADEAPVALFVDAPPAAAEASAKQKKGTNWEALRAERLAREAAERERATAVVVAQARATGGGVQLDEGGPRAHGYYGGYGNAGVKRQRRA